MVRKDMFVYVWTKAEVLRRATVGYNNATAGTGSSFWRRALLEKAWVQEILPSRDQGTD